MLGCLAQRINRGGYGVDIKVWPGSFHEPIHESGRMGTRIYGVYPWGID